MRTLVAIVNKAPPGVLGAMLTDSSTRNARSPLSPNLFGMVALLLDTAGTVSRPVPSRAAGRESGSPWPSARAHRTPAGVLPAIGAGRLIAAELHGVSDRKPLALFVAAGTLATCALSAAIIPAGPGDIYALLSAEAS